MDESRIAFLQQLVNTPSPSGFEQPIQRIIRGEFDQYADEVRSDVLGNVIGVLDSQSSPRVMITGHCDEIGFMVRHISEEGYIYFAPIGGIDRQVITSHRVMVHNAKGPVLGALGRQAIHLMSDDERKKIFDFHEMWIDIGAKNKEDALARVAIGDPITLTDSFDRLTDDLVLARAFDDKVGAFIVTEVLRSLAENRPQATVFAVSTVQEEIGLRGAVTSAFGLEPDVAIAIDVGHATDYPGVDKKKAGDVKLGQGPLLYRGANMNPVVVDLLIKAANTAEIPFQMVAAPSGPGTDAHAVQLSKTGVATAVVSPGLRYMHSPAEIVSLSDLENVAKLVAAFIHLLEPGMNFIPL